MNLLWMTSIVMGAPVQVYLGAATDVPLDIAARVTVEGPYRLRLTTSVGWMPAGYLDLINGISVEAGWYDTTTASLIAVSLQNAIVWRTHLGWRPFPRHGFQFEVGYGMASLGGGLSAAEAVETLTGQTFPRDAGEDLAVSLGATVHMIDVSAGWEWVIRDHLFVRADLGGAFTLAAQSHITPDWEITHPRVQTAVDEITAEGESYLNDTFTTYVHTPTVGLGVGWRF